MKSRNQTSCSLILAVILAVALSNGTPVRAQQVVGGQCGVCGQWYLGSHYCTPPSQPQGYPAWSSGTAEPENHRLSREANQAGMNYHNRHDYLNAIRQYKLALQYRPDNEYARENLRLASRAYSRESNNAGAEFHRSGDFENALRFYQLALQYWPENGVARNNLELALESIRNKLAREQAARERAEMQRRIAESERKIDRILSQAKSDFDGRRTGATANAASTPGLEFTQSFATEPPPPLDSSVVDLRDRKTEIVFPDKVKGTTAGAKKRMTASPKTVALLDALQAGRGNWDKSLAWLRSGVVRNPSSDAARDAYHYVLGLSDGLGERVPTSPLDDYNLPDKPGTVRTMEDPAIRNLARDALAAIADENYSGANQHFAAALQKLPNHQGIRDCVHWSEGMAAAKASQASGGEVDGQLLALIREQVVHKNQEAKRREIEREIEEFTRDYFREEAMKSPTSPAPAAEKGYFQRLKEFFGGSS